MSRLERDLRALGHELDLPAAPDLAPGVLARLGFERGPRPRWTRGRLVSVAVAVLAVALAAALAVPPARTALQRLFGVGGVSVRLVERLPVVPASGSVAPGERVTLAEARRRASFGVPLPEGAEPDEVRYAAAPVEQVTLVYRDGEGVRLLVAYHRARLASEFAGKLVGPDTSVRMLTVEGRPALWIEGRTHVLFYVDAAGEVVGDSARLARDTLVWQRAGGVTARLEGELTLDRALRLARTLGP